MTSQPTIPSTQSRVILVNRPEGDIDPDLHSGKGTFKLETNVPIAQPSKGEALIKVEWSSIDPAMRGWLDDARSYMPPVELGAVMRAGVVGRIVSFGPDTSSDTLSIGDYVSAYVGWQEYAPAPLATLQKVPSGIEPEKVLSVLGMVAQTAYWGLFDVAQLSSKDKVVLVSGAAGAVGSIAIQLAKLTGCENVIGIAGGADKCRYVQETLGADACLDYKSATFKDDLKKIGFVDVYFDNVGGEILDLVLAQLAVHARIAFCGAISQYNSRSHTPLTNYVQLIMQKSKLHGFVVIDYIPRFGEALQKLAGWYKEGKLQLAEHRIEGGVDKCVDALCDIFKGANTGKMLVQIAKE